MERQPRLITELNLLWISVVYEPVNPACRIVWVKTEDDGG